MSPRPLALLVSLILAAAAAPAPVCASEVPPAVTAGDGSSCPHPEEGAPCGPACACLCCSCQLPDSCPAQGLGGPVARLIGHHLPGVDRLDPQEVHSRIYYPPRA